MEGSRKGDQEIVVFMIRGRESSCSECGEDISRNGFLRKEGERALCLECADLGDLEFLPSGDPALTRRASKYSRMRAVVVQWSRSRKRYERQGILVEPEAIGKAEEESLQDADLRERRRIRSASRGQEIDREYVAEFAKRIRKHYPAMPATIERDIADHACRKYSGRVGRSAAAKDFEGETIDLAVAAYVRHAKTPYDDLLNRGYERTEARNVIRKDVDRILCEWRGN